MHVRVVQKYIENSEFFFQVLTPQIIPFHAKTRQKFLGRSKMNFRGSLMWSKILTLWRWAIFTIWQQGDAYCGGVKVTENVISLL